MISTKISEPEPFPSIARGTPSTRQRLKPWLMAKINEGQCPGLTWIDPEAYIFRIPWKHFGKPGVDGEVDAKVFRDWAIHTGKYHQGDPPDPSTWKTRFRCALYKLPDIEEQAELNVLDGDSPYRVYKFLSKDEVAAKGNTKKPENDYDSIDGRNTLSPAESTTTDYDGAYSTDDMFAVSPASAVGNMIDMDDNFDISKIEPGFDSNWISGLIGEGITNPEDFIENVFKEDYSAPTQPAVKQEEVDTSSQNHVGVSSTVEQPLTRANYNPLRVQIFYRGKAAADRLINNPQGLRFAYEPPPPLPEDIAKDDSVSVVTQIFGPFLAEQLYFPQIDDKAISLLLEHIKRGLVIQALNGDVFATRLCRAKVFYSQSFHGTPSPNELARENTTKVFDMNEFESQLQRHREGIGPPPACEVFFSIGQKWNANHPLKDNLVYVSVTHGLAYRQLEQLGENQQDVLVSEPNMFDRLRKEIETLYVN